MKSIKITTFKDGEPDPEITITIPSNVFKIANQIIPKKVLLELERQEIDLKIISDLLESSDALGTIIEIEDHRQYEKTVISIE